MRKRTTSLRRKLLSLVLSVTVASGTLIMAPVASVSAAETENTAVLNSGVSIDKFEADTYNIPVGETKTVTFKATVSGVTNSAANDITVVDSDQNVIGYMSDNGTNGDGAASDGTFTMQAKLWSDEAKTVSFYASVNGSSGPSVNIEYYNPTSEEEWNALHVSENKIEACLKADSFKQKNEAEKAAAVDELLGKMAENGEIKADSVYYDEKGMKYYFEYASSTPGVIMLKDFDEKYNSPAGEDISLEPIDAGQVIDLASGNKAGSEAVGDTSGKTALVLNGFEDTSFRRDFYENLQSDWNGVNLSTTVDVDVTVEDMKSFGSYDVNVIAMHGTDLQISGSIIYVIVINQTVTSSTDARYDYEINTRGSVIKAYSDDGAVYCIAPLFFSDSYSSTALRGKLIFSETCEFYGCDEYSTTPDYRLANAIYGRGAGAVVGYHNSVLAVYSRNVMKYVVEQCYAGTDVTTALNNAKNRYGATDGQSEMAAYPILTPTGSTFVLGGSSTLTYETIKLNSAKTVNITTAGNIKYFKFTPTASMTINFFSSGGSDTYGYIYSSSLSQLASDDDSGDNRNFKFTYQVSANTTYILGCKFYSSSATGSFIVTLTSNVVSDFFEFNGHYYKLYDSVCNTWEEAKTYCKNLGGHLATISSSLENDAVYSYIVSCDYRNAYFGFTDGEIEGVWKWVNQESVSYTNWHSGEPNDESGEDYAMYYWKFTDGTWNDGNFGHGTSSDQRVFICEWDDSKFISTSGTTGSCTWSLSNGTLTITGNGAMGDQNDYEYYADTDTYNYNLPWGHDIKKVVIGSGVTRIGTASFHYCKSLSSVTLPSSLKEIGEKAFNGCPALPLFTIPNSVTKIEATAFRACTGLTSLTIGSSVKTIGEKAFYYCKNLKSVTIPKNVTSIGAMAFGYNSSTKLVEDFIIYGYKGTAAETYAKANNITFSALDASALSAPVLSLSNTADGLKASWSKVTNAKSYEVYYKASTDSSWTKATTTGTSYIITGAVSGKLYYVKAKSVGADGTKSDYSATKSMTYIAQANISSLTYNGSAVNAKWGKIGGATRYQVAYKKNGESSFTTKTVTTNTFALSNAASATSYTFKVRAQYVKDGSTTSGLWSAEKTVVTLAKPTVTAVRVSKDLTGIYTSWKAVSGATKYRVYYKLSTSSSWYIKVTSSLSYTIKNTPKGKVYNVKICAACDAGGGALSPVYSVAILDAPTVTAKVSSGKTGIYTSWSKVTGADKYVINYRKSGDSAWTTHETANLTYTLKNLTAGATYQIKVAAMKGDGIGPFSEVASVVFK